MPTNTFIDSATEMAQVVLVFFTPNAGIITGTKTLENLWDWLTVLNSKP